MGLPIFPLIFIIVGAISLALFKRNSYENLLENNKIYQDPPRHSQFITQTFRDFTLNEVTNNNDEVNPVKTTVPEDAPNNKTDKRKVCKINVNGDIGEPQPLILIPGTTKFKYPQSRAGIIFLNIYESVELFCTSSTLATCQSNGQFLIDGSIRNFKEYKCKILPSPTVRNTGYSCHGGASILEIGFYLSGGRFTSLMEICHDAQMGNNHWVHNKLSPVSVAFQKNYPRPAFKTGGFYRNLNNIDDLYKITSQQQVFAEILGISDIAANPVQGGTIYLARGHLAPKVDYIFGSQQNATFYFVNAAPQWQNFNANNWRRLEDGLREMAAVRYKNLDIYTGTHGVVIYPNAFGVEKKLYLSINNGLKQIPVPNIFFKVVIEPASDSGIVFIGINNIHATLDELETYIYCTDVASQIDWIKWDVHNFKRGYMYACEVNEFIKFVDVLPGINVSKLLV